MNHTPESDEIVAAAATQAVKDVYLAFTDLLTSGGPLDAIRFAGEALIAAGRARPEDAALNLVAQVAITGIAYLDDPTSDSEDRFRTAWEFGQIVSHMWLEESGGSDQ
jgi:hypothetical protein